MKNNLLENLKTRARALKKEIYALYLVCRDERTPWYAKLFAACVVGYAFSPIDLIPDFIPVLGLLDNLILVPLGIVLVIKMTPAQVMDDCRQKAGEITDKPTNWYAAAVVALIWLMVLALSIWLVSHSFKK